jgi:hypothetical protein
VAKQVLQQFLDRYPFSSTKVRSRHLCLSPPTMKEILTGELDLKKFIRK